MSSSSDQPSVITIISSDPLFSTLFSFFALVLLNFPRLLWSLLFSPVFLLTGFLLLSLLRLGATDHDRNNQSQIVPEINETQESNPNDDTAVVRPEEDCDGNDAVSEEGGLKGVGSCACLEEKSFVHWNVRAPLEVIYEEYEGEDHDNDVSNEPDEQVRIGSQIRYPSLSLYYPETDSDSSSDSDDEFPMAGDWDSVDDNVCFTWDVEEDRDELIEIALDKTSNKASDLQLEEENLIEIDISPT